MQIIGQQLNAALIKALGLPRNTLAFTLRAKVGDIVTVECEYYPDDGGIVAALAEYGLVPRDSVRVHRIGEPEPRGILAKPAPHRAEVIGFDAWMRERTERAHRIFMASMASTSLKTYATGGILPSGLRIAGECVQPTVNATAP
jgi:hypothetical protein